MQEIVPIVPVEGNTKTSTEKKPKIVKQCSPSKKWCFTEWLENGDIPLYSSPLEMISSIKSKLSNISHLSFQIEQCPSTQKTHAQGAVIFLNKVRPKSLLSNSCHWEKMRGSWSDNLNYTRKGYTQMYPPYTYPEPPAKYNLKKVVIDELTEWQQDAYKIMEGEPVPRTIHWYYSEKGNLSKSYFCTHVIDNISKRVMIFDDTTKGHVHYAFCGGKDGIELIKKNEYMYPEIVIFDLPRAINEEKVDYKTIESILDQRFLNTKFESKMVRFNQPHVFVFANFRPDTTDKYMSKDRFIICCLDNNEEETQVKITKRIITPQKKKDQDFNISL